MDWLVVVIILQVIFLEGVLSIDNAAILGSMVSEIHPTVIRIGSSAAESRIGIFIVSTPEV